jgi:hypothetical protein
LFCAGERPSSHISTHTKIREPNQGWLLSQRVHRKVGSQPASQPLPAASETAPLQIEDRAAAGKHRAAAWTTFEARAWRQNSKLHPFYLSISPRVQPSRPTRSHTYDDSLYSTPFLLGLKKRKTISAANLLPRLCVRPREIITQKKWCEKFQLILCGGARSYFYQTPVQSASGSAHHLFSLSLFIKK